jgi:hypothetical protein
LNAVTIIIDMIKHLLPICGLFVSTTFCPPAQAGPVGRSTSPPGLIRLPNALADVATSALPNHALDVRSYGAKCDGATDDATAINAALNSTGSTGGGTVWVPSGTCKVKSTITIPYHVTLMGMGRRSSIISAGATNMNPIIQFGAGSQNVIQDLEIQANSAGANTSGAAISTATFGYVTDGAAIRNVWINGPCIGIDLSGNTQTVEDTYIDGVRGAGCYGIRVGHYTTSAATVDPRITGSTIAANQADPADADLLVEDAGGLFLAQDDFLFAKVGTKLEPGLNQAIEWPTLGSSYYGDTNSVTSMMIDTADPSAVIRGLVANGGWSSSSSGVGILLQNTAGGLVSGLHFLGMRIFNNRANAVEVHSGVNGFTIEDSDICGNASNASGIYLLAGVSDFVIHGNRMSEACAGFATNSRVGVNLVGANANGSITDNNFSDLNTAINNNPTLDSIVANNIPVNTEALTRRDAADIALAGGRSAIRIIGKGTIITNMTGAWNGRKIELYNANKMTFAPGGAAGSAICNALTSPPNTPVEGSFFGCWYLK